ncbi:MAG: DMT family transporter [Gammaproteobacteria bacterium]
MAIPRNQLTLWLCFSSVVLVWGTTWYAIKLQTNGTDPVFSVAIRFALAAAILFGLLIATRRKLAVCWNDLPSLLMMGALFFGFNYILAYKGTEYLISGLVALVFSVTVIFNLLNEVLFFRKAISAQKVIAASMGIVGLALVFHREIAVQSIDQDLLLGAGFVIAAAWVVSLGNFLAAKILSNQLPILTLNSYGMLFGAILSGTYLLVSNPGFEVVITPSYIWSLLYLAIMGSVLAFALYMQVVKLAGPTSASYTSVMFPLVALVVSTFFEAYSWQLLNVAGVILLTIGNILILKPKTMQPRKT